MDFVGNYYSLSFQVPRKKIKKEFSMWIGNFVVHLKKRLDLPLHIVVILRWIVSFYISIQCHIFQLYCFDLIFNLKHGSNEKPMRNRRILAGEELLRFLKCEHEGVIKNGFLRVFFFFKSCRIFIFYSFFLEQDRCSFGKLDHWTQLSDHLIESDPHVCEFLQILCQSDISCDFPLYSIYICVLFFFFDT